MIDAIITIVSIIGASLLSAISAYQRLWGRIVCGGLLVLPLAAAWERTARAFGAEVAPSAATALLMGGSVVGLMVGHGLVRRWIESGAAAGASTTETKSARAYRSQVRRESKERVRIVTRKERR